MPFGPFILQWRAPSPNPPSPTPLPKGISRSFITTSSGPLELLSAIPSEPTSKPPLFFAHGGFGCAEVWTNYMQFFVSRGYPCYAISYRGHGKSWYPSFWQLYFTTRDAMGTDLVAGIEHVEKLERERIGGDGRVVLVAHSAGGALSQYVLSRGLVKVRAFCMCAAVPGFGSWGCYTHWALTAPINMLFRAGHSRYLLSTVAQVHSAFFTASTPRSLVANFSRLLSPYESMLWPMQGLNRFVTGPDVTSAITGWGNATKSEVKSTAQQMLVLAAEKDALCKPHLLEDAAQRYEKAYEGLVRSKKIDGVEDVDGMGSKGVRFRVVDGLGHHVQNELEWEKSAEEILSWTEQLN